LQAGANMNHPMADGSTPLHFAAVSGHVEITRCLLNYGADPTRRNDEWRTPLQTAEESGNVEVAALLKEAVHRRSTL